jgi:PAS domain S-box-containing protein
MGATPVIRMRQAVLARLASALALLIGLDVIIGRSTGTALLLRAVPGADSMALLSALAFVLTAATLWLAANATSSLRDGSMPAWQVGGIAVALIGAIRLALYAFGWTPDVDSLGLHGSVASSLDGHTAHMSLATAADFLLLGTAMAVAHTRRAGVAMQTTAWLSGLLGWLGMSHYIFGGEALPAFAQMSLPTATLFMALSVGALSIRPEMGFIALTMSDGPGGRISRRVLPAIIVFPIVFGWLCLTAHRSGWLGIEAAIALFAFSNIVVFGGLIWRSAGALNRLDTERNAAQRALAAELQLLDFALQVHHMGAWDLDLLTGATHRTLTHARIFGYTPPLREWSYGMFLDHVVPGDRPEVERRFREAVEMQHDFHIECRIRRADGEIRDIVSSGSHVHNPEGLATRLRGVVQDVTERKHAEAQEQRMVALVASADDAILSKSLEGTILSWNPGAEQLLGYRAAEIVGQPGALLLPDGRKEEEIAILEQIRRGERVKHFETVRRRKDGSLVEVSLTVSPIRNGAGAIIGASKIMRDITERKRYENELRRGNTELAQTNRELDEFVYTASHDLRSPLTAVGSVVQWILEDDHALSALSHERLLLIQARLGRMHQLLTDVRDFARAGREAMAEGSLLGAATLVAEVADTLHVPAGFRVVSDPSLETVLVGRVPLQQVLHNLISNAIKHHDQASGTITVSAQTRGAWYRFSVIDDGPGIPDEYHEVVFEMFQTLRPRDAVEGSGMGLAFVRKIVGKMSGRCGIEPVRGRGAHFWFDWPVPAPHVIGPGAAVPAATDARG